MNPFYYTWTKQKGADSFDLKEVSGSWIKLENAQEVLDFSSLSFQANLGLSHKNITRAILLQLDKFSLMSPKANFHLKTNTSKEILRLIDQPGKIFYTLSGAESVENALKIARQITGKTKVLCRKKSYHGATMGALSVTGDWRNEAHETQDEWVVRIPEPSDDPVASELEKIIKKNKNQIAAIITESVSGVNGVEVPPKAWFQQLEQLCKQYNIILICDEVLCGFYRTGPAFAYQDYGIQADIVCMSKGITAGYVPFGAVYTSMEIAKFYENSTLSCGLTNYAHPLGLAATSACLQEYSNNEKHRKILMTDFEKHLEILNQQDEVDHINYKGLLAAIFLKKEAPSFNQFIEKGLYVVTRDNSIILAPNYIMNEKEMRIGFEKLAEVISE